MSKKDQEIPVGRQPLVEYPWSEQIENLLNKFKAYPPHYHAFLFDFVMSLAYVDSTLDLAKNIEFCENSPRPYNTHMGFINLCANCHAGNVWQYQKAAKPQSGVIGKLSSEIILKFIACLYPHFTKVEVLGGTGLADAKLEHMDGTVILAEVKSAPLITFPLLLNINVGHFNHHQNPQMTHSQMQYFNSALLIFQKVIPLGKVGGELWPFKPAVEFILNGDNSAVVDDLAAAWLETKNAYETKNKEHSSYFLTNACGQPPLVAKTQGLWPAKEVISDSKTTVGMDRTDDIKKGMYQTLKIGVTFNNPLVKTAIISNLPAIRHKTDYVDPIIPILWGHQDSLEPMVGNYGILRENLKYVVDYVITLEEPLQMAEVKRGY